MVLIHHRLETKAAALDLVIAAGVAACQRSSLAPRFPRISSEPGDRQSHERRWTGLLSGWDCTPLRPPRARSFPVERRSPARPRPPTAWSLEP
jgi:hypothetical protein